MLQSEDRDFGAGVEAHVVKVSYAAVDVEAAIVGEGEFTGGVAAVLNRKQGGGQEGGLALSAMRVAGQNPALVVLPNGQVAGVGIMAEHQSRL